MVVRQRTYLRVRFQERVAELVVTRPTLQLGQRDREVVQVEAPAAIVEVDRSRLTTMKEEVLVVEVSVDEAEGTGLLRQRSRRCPDELEGSREQRCVIGRNESVDSWPEEPGGRRPRRPVLLQLSRKSADSPQVRGSETLVDEPPIEPVQQNADVGCGHASVACDDDERAVARGDGFGYAKVGVASESAKPGHLGTDRVGRMNPRSIDAQQIRPVIRVNSE